MSVLSINHKNLGELSAGQAGLVIDAAIRQAATDFEERGREDEKPRVVTITLTMLSKGGQYAVDVQAGVKLPALRTDVTIVHPKKRQDGQTALLFEQFNPEAPDQPTLFEGED